MTIPNYHMVQMWIYILEWPAITSFLLTLYIHPVTGLSMDLPGQLHIMWYDCEMLVCIAQRFVLSNKDMGYSSTASLECHKGCCLQMHVMPSRGVHRISNKSTNNKRPILHKYYTS